ncbi:hypothetical protein [Streptomyces sp. 4R-3d]|uniref:hypothetical protein n=1 Tax=Streptomyces sp. 4R-3d TaxID=2559605 RepID=UPI001072E017|nr:hypothetical protein [Streptomyces sp. 4R-3d]TFI21313.1 hypothetical protein E4P36_33555 [Streptomyces sp. 4R-3d]
MNPDVRRELIPRDEVLYLIGVLDGMKAKLLDAAEQWQLLDDTGRVPSTPAYADLIQHAAGAHTLAHGVVELAADFARSPHSTTRAGRAVLAHLATAATLSSNAPPRFTETAETALFLAGNPITNRYRANSMVLDHATARAYLRRTSESLGAAATELNNHLGLHQLFPTPSRQQSPPSPPPGPGTRRR